MDDDANDAFDGFSAMFNIRGYHLRRGKEADKSADEGASPLAIGLLDTPPISPPPDVHIYFRRSIDT